MPSIITLKKSNCKNCYKCIRHCPVKSIRFSGNQAHILQDECVLCGNCFVVCPQNAKEIIDSTEKVKVILSSFDHVVATLAPSFIANYKDVSFASMKKALMKLGFHDVMETAVGATIVKDRYEEMVRENKNRLMLTSCCHTVNLLIEKHFPEALPYLLNVVTPMMALGQEIKKKDANAKVVFIGPCISKKDEIEKYPGAIDAVLTFEELSKMLKEEEIELEQDTQKIPNSRARLFPIPGGILDSMHIKDLEDVPFMVIDGMDKCIDVLKDIRNGEIKEGFIEMSACEGSCVGGPVMENKSASTIKSMLQIKNAADKKDFEIAKPEKNEIVRNHVFLGTGKTMPGETEIRQVLRQMGKNKKEDELNCGSCGYDTCREKAVAICLGKADLSMCLPFLKEKAESFSDNIIKNTPNGILVLNEALEVQQINTAALKMFNLTNASDVLGDQVVCILDPKPFMDVRNTSMPVKDKRTYLAEYKRYVDQTIVYDNDYKLLICILRDVSNETRQREKQTEVNRQTVLTADKVVEKQMRVVQEIASLLGETAAETKIALTQLKESITHE